MIHFYKDDIKNLPTILIKNCARKCHEKKKKMIFFCGEGSYKHGSRGGDRGSGPPPLPEKSQVIWVSIEISIGTTLEKV